MEKRVLALTLLSTLALALLAGCGGNATTQSSEPTPPNPLSSDNVNLIFVASQDLAFGVPGEMNPTTANLTDQGLQRALLTATFLQQTVLGMQNVTAIYALEPMTHPQTANQYPDMVGLETIEQFAMINQITLSSNQYGAGPLAAYSYPIHASYSLGSLPGGVPVPDPLCANCQGIDFADQHGDNEALVTGILHANVPGFYVVSAPWETVSRLMTNINRSEGYNLALPASYISPNFIYAMAITTSGSGSLFTYDSHITPSATYPVLSPPVASGGCTQQVPPFSVTVTGGQNGTIVPAGANTNETLYFIRHADAHPTGYWNDNNYIAAGQWRALDLPNALAGKVSPLQVYSIDPAQAGPGSIEFTTGDHTFSSVAPALTAMPYAIANNLPYNLVTGFQLSDSNVDTETANFFFSGGKFSNQSVLVAWAYQFIQPTIHTLLENYHATPQQLAQLATWPPGDYDTIWTIQLDAVGNVTVSNGSCEGISSKALPSTPPRF